MEKRREMHNKLIFSTVIVFLLLCGCSGLLQESFKDTVEGKPSHIKYEGELLETDNETYRVSTTLMLVKDQAPLPIWPPQDLMVYILKEFGHLDQNSDGLCFSGVALGLEYGLKKNGYASAYYKMANGKYASLQLLYHKDSNQIEVIYNEDSVKPTINAIDMGKVIKRD